LIAAISETDRQTDRQAGRLTDGRMSDWMDERKDGQTNIQTDRPEYWE
jgi:hypothetical protein